MNIIEIAEVAHEVNRAYCLALGDDSQLAWEDSPKWQQDSAIAGTIFHINNLNVSPESSHENWRLERWLDGWKYGPVKDINKKEHPCCVPYGELPEGQKAKDYIFSAIIAQLAPFHLKG